MKAWASMASEMMSRSFYGSAVEASAMRYRRPFKNNTPYLSVDPEEANFVGYETEIWGLQRSSRLFCC